MTNELHLLLFFYFEAYNSHTLCICAVFIIIISILFYYLYFVIQYNIISHLLKGK